jgi:hypothetical protein
VTIAVTAAGPPRTSGLLGPGLPLLGQGAGFVLGLPGFQGGLLGQLDGLHHRRWAAVVGLERRREHAAAGLDRDPAGGPPRVQARVDPDDLADRALAPVGAFPLREDQPEAGPQVLLQGGVVRLGRGHVGLEQDPPIDESHFPDRVCTLFATATWVCRSGSPARESRCVNAVATSPVTST